MSAGTWMRRQRDRPLSEHGRRAPLAATATVLIAAALLFANTRPTQCTQARRTVKTAVPVAVDPRRAAPGPSAEGALSPNATTASRAFLAGYLSYTYGGTSASRITAATRALLTTLAEHPPRISPAMRSTHPRVVELHSALAPAGEIGVSAVVNDGGVVDYTLGLILTHHGGRLLVYALEQS